MQTKEKRHFRGWPKIDAGGGRSKRSLNSYYTKHAVASISLVGFFQGLNILDLVGV